MTEDDKQKAGTYHKSTLYQGGKLVSKLRSLVGSQDHCREKVNPAKEHHFAHVEIE
jgi:hypothetical protein